MDKFRNGQVLTHMSPSGINFGLSSFFGLHQRFSWWPIIRCKIADDLSFFSVFQDVDTWTANEWIIWIANEILMKEFRNGLIVLLQMNWLYFPMENEPQPSHKQTDPIYF